jgi:F-type H+-transporting ATPase subunit epsilon
MSFIKLSIVTPKGIIYTGEVKEVYATAANGEIGVLPDHVPFISTTEPGIIHFTDLESKENFFVASIGFIQVDENVVEILVEDAKSHEEVDTPLIESKIIELNSFLSGKGLNDDGYQKSASQLKYYTKMLELKK